MAVSMIGAALSYAARGWKVFPCSPKSKKPLKGSNGCKDATDDPEQIREWWDETPNANIALACGPGSGVYVVDVDFDADGTENGWEDLKDFPELPRTVRQDTPRGGAHFLFKSDTPPRNKNKFRPGIDIRADGYYIMLSPSVHPNGKTYAWAPGLGPDDVELADFPDFMRPAKKILPPWIRQKPEESPKQAAPRPPEAPGATPITERARLYLAACEPSIQGQNGHEKLLWAARALVVGFEMSESEAISLLWADFNHRCIPPWDSGSPSERRDFERKVSEAAKTPGHKPRGWLLDEYGLRGDTEAAALGEKLARSLLAPKTIAEEPDVPEVVKRKSQGGQNDFPDWILNPPGLVGKISSWINRTAGCPQPALSVAASITACGALFGRKVRDQSNGRTNVFMMGVAPSSAGKDHPGDCIERLFFAAGASGLIGGSRVTSDTAIEVALQSNPAQMFIIDEAGHFFSSIKQAGAGSGSASHLRTIIPALMQLYSSPHKLFIGKQHAEGEPRRIDQPHVCIWGLTSPDILMDGLTTSELRDGWLGRVITVMSSSRPKFEMKNSEPPPQDIIEEISRWVSFLPKAPGGIGNVASACGVHQIELPATDSAMIEFNRFRDYCYENMIKCDRVGDDTQYLWGKGLQNARRTSLIISSGDGCEKITEEHARYGCEYIRICIEQFRAMIRESMANNSWEAEKQKIYKIIGKRGARGISKSELTRMTQFVRDRRSRDSYVDDLREAGMIEVEIHSSRNALWLWKAGARKEEANEQKQ